ncbi:MAG: DNA ligase [Lachnospirales bacterium]
MSQMKEMKITIQRLRECAVVITETADYLAKVFNGETETQKEPKEEKALKLEDVRIILAEKSRSGKTAEVKALISTFGAEKLSDIDQSNYAELLKKAKVL